MNRFWLYCHGCHTGIETNPADAVSFLLSHGFSCHALITRLRVEHMREWEEGIVSGAEKFLEETK